MLHKINRYTSLKNGIYVKVKFHGWIIFIIGYMTVMTLLVEIVGICKKKIYFTSNQYKYISGNGIYVKVEFRELIIFIILIRI